MRILDLRKKGIPPGYDTLLRLSRRWGKSMSWLETVCREKIGRIGAGAVLVPTGHNTSLWLVKVDPGARPIEHYMEEAGLRYDIRWCVRDLVVETGVPAAKIRKLIDKSAIKAELVQMGHYISYQFDEAQYRAAVEVLTQTAVTKRNERGGYSNYG